MLYALGVHIYIIHYLHFTLTFDIIKSKYKIYTYYIVLNRNSLVYALYAELSNNYRYLIIYNRLIYNKQ